MNAFERGRCSSGTKAGAPCEGPAAADGSCRANRLATRRAGATPAPPATSHLPGAVDAVSGVLTGRKGA